MAGATKCIGGQSSEVKSKVCCEVHSLLLVSVLFQLIEICVVGVVIFSTACSWLGVCVVRFYVLFLVCDTYCV